MRSSGKRRSESELLGDPRRRPQFHGAAASQQTATTGAAAPDAAATRGFRSSAMVQQLHAAAQQHAQATTPARPTRGTAAVTSAPSADRRESASSRRLTPIEIERTLDQQWPGDVDNFTLDGVRLEHGEVVAPVLQAGARGGGRDELVEVDLFVLHQLVRRRYGGFNAVSKRQWVDVLRTMLNTARIAERRDLFQANDARRTADDEQSNGSGKSPTKRGPSQADSFSSTALHSMADQLRQVYRVQLLPLEQYVTRHRQEQEVALSDNEDEADADTEMKDEAAQRKPASSSSLPGEEMPMPVFSMDQIRKWTLIRARKQRQQAAAATQDHARAGAAQPAESASSASGQSRTRATASSASKSNPQLLCLQCNVDNLAPMCQCHHCHQSSLTTGTCRASGAMK